MINFKQIFLILIFSVSSAFCKVEEVRYQEIASFMSSIKTMSCKIKNLEKSNDESKLFLKSENIPQIKIESKGDGSQDILIKGSVLMVFDKKSEKIQKTSISNSPIYQLLTGKFDFKKHKIEVFAESKEGIAYSFDKRQDGFIPLKLIFAKYPNGNLKYLIGWEIDGGKNITKYGIVEETIRINDPKTVPDFVFRLPSEK